MQVKTSSSDQMMRNRVRYIKTVAIIIGVVVFLPILVPYPLIRLAIDDRRRKGAANNFICIRCGDILGQPAIAKADDYCRRQGQKLRERFPGTKFRFIRKVWAICTKCGAVYNYRTDDRTYALNPLSEAETLPFDN